MTDRRRSDQNDILNRTALLESLSKDPSLRFTESGRVLLRKLLAGAGAPPGRELLEALPPHCVYTMASLARAYAHEWSQLARQLEHKLPSEL
jgi:hypothetical protein